jgi:dihydroflavonol-4-reductase
MRVLVTGATGKVGHATARAAVEAGHEVRALVRDLAAARGVLPEGVEPVRGDVTELGSLKAAVAGCEVVFNAMGLPEQWLPDEGAFDRVNVQGTAAVVRAAGRADVRRVVHTSTIDVFDADATGVLRETQLATAPKGTAYERSKQAAERAARDQAAAQEIELVFTNPAAVFGPGPLGSASIERDFLEPVARGRRLKVPFCPPGGLGLAFTGSVGRGQLLAAEHGVPGERYILCDGHATFRELAERVVRLHGRGRVPPVLPARPARVLAAAGEQVARVIKRPPLLPAGQLHFFLWNARPSADKARAELGWEPTPLDDGLRATLIALGLL